jgi:hypothetical protein
MVTNLLYPLTIRHVFPSNRAQGYHPEYGYPFSQRGDYLIPAEEYNLLLQKYSQKYKLTIKDVELLALWVINPFSSLFYHQGTLDCPAYQQFWEAVCRNHHLTLEVSSFDQTRLSEETLPGWTEYYHTKAIYDAILVSANSSIDELIYWYEFSIKCSTHPSLEGKVYDQLSARYLRQRRKDFHLALDAHCHHEGDFYVTLRKNDTWCWRPAATCGFRLIPPMAIIENLQGGRSQGELPKFGWKWLLVKATEHFLLSLGVDKVFFRPAANHWYKRQAGEKHLYYYMDKTAQELRYQPFFDPQGKLLIYGKSLKEKETIDPMIFNIPEFKQLLALKLDESSAI